MRRMRAFKQPALRLFPVNTAGPRLLTARTNSTIHRATIRETREAPMRKHYLLFAVILSTVCVAPARADTFIVDTDTTLVGDLRGVKSRAEYSLVDVARYFNLGYNEITAANRQLNVWLPGDDKVVLVPSRFILPDAPRKGIVLNLAEMRLYYFRMAAEPGHLEISTYPVGVGREGWATPQMTTAVSVKKVKPSWFVPESILAEYLAKGTPLPPVVGPGPENPLGEYALRLGGSSYLIHGTNKPGGIGMRVSHGCIRLYPEDIENLFAQVDVGTEVRIVDQPAKAALHDGQLYLEVHPASSDDVTPEQLLGDATRRIARAALGHTVKVDWARVHAVLGEASGVPTVVGSLGPIDKRRRWVLIAGSFAAEQDALSLVAQIGAARLDSRAWKIADRYQVEVGPFADAQQADYARQLIRKRTGILALKIPPG